MKHRLLLAAILAFNFWLMAPELRITGHGLDQNDCVLHGMLIQDMAEAHNPFDFWSPTIAMGMPIARLYQTGAHMLVVGIWKALFGTVSLMTVFVWVRFFSVALLPLSFYACARLLGLSKYESLGAAMLSWMISGDSWGLDFGSYAWAGHGMFPQAVATHFLLLAIGTGWWALRSSSSKWRWIAPAVLLAATGWTNLLYGYVGGVTLLLIAVLPGEGRRRRIMELAKIAAFGVGFAAPKVLAWVQDSPYMGKGKWVAGREWMTDGLGASVVMKQLFTGEVLDHGRLPLLTAIAAAGVVVIAWKRRSDALAVFLATGMTVFLLLSFGATFWGPFIKLAGVTKAFQIHRLVGPMELFLVLIAGIGLATGFELARKRFGLPVAVVACLVILSPGVQDRMSRMQANAQMGDANIAAQHKAAPAIQDILSSVRAKGGRVYAGFHSHGTPPGWGAKTGAGAVPLFATFTSNRVPNIGFYYIGFLDANDNMYDFNDQREQSYVDFNVTSVVSYMAWDAPDFLKLRQIYGDFAVYDAPGRGYFDNSVCESASSQEYQATVRRDAAGEVLLRASFHPHWKGTVDGGPTGVRIASNGFMLVSVPAGEHEVKVRYN